MNIAGIRKAASSRLLGALITIYLLGMGIWIYRAGMQLREDVWSQTRTLREENNISSGFRWGTLVLRTAEKTADSDAMKKWRDPSAPYRPARAVPKPGERELTVWEIIRGEDQVYQDIFLGKMDTGNFDLDYPPLRLMMMTLWAHHVERQIPDLESWPGFWRMNYSPTGDRLLLADEDLAKPILLVNTYTIAASALAAFFLVWIWVHRGGRPNLPGKQRKIAPWKITPPRKANGLILFPLAAWAFFYAMLIAEMPTPPPPPAVAFAGRPNLTKGADGKISALINATIDTQGGDTQWHVDWGTSSFYINHTPPQASGDDDASATLSGLNPHTLIHYRLTAANERGSVHSDDQTFNTSDALPPQPPTHWYGRVWLTWPQWLGIGMLFIAMIAAMNALPPEHRGWAAAMVAAFLMWLDPAVLMDTHVWPQWDAWALLPFFLAALLATLDGWFVAGLILGVGVMFKGQLLLVTPILFVWPLFAARFGAAARMIIGALLSAGLALFPWIVLANDPPTWTAGPLRWIPSVLLAAVIAAAVALFCRRLWKSEMTTPRLATISAVLLAAIILCTLLLLRRWPADSEIPRLSGLILLLGILVPPWLLRKSTLAVWMACILAASIWMSAYLFHGDWSWKAVGFDYGTRKHPQMAVPAPGMGNVPLALQSRFGWDIYDTALTVYPPDLASAFHWPTRQRDGTLPGWTHDWGWDGTPVALDIRTFLIVVFAIIMILCGVGAAIHSRRNDPRILACFAAVWILMPNVLCQMHVRYQMWAAAVSCILVGVAPELGILHAVLSLLATGMIGATLMTVDGNHSPKIRDLMLRFRPDDGWIMLVLGLIVLYLAVAPGKRPPRQELLLP